jgi:hypothetical protein
MFLEASWFIMHDECDSTHSTSKAWLDPYQIKYMVLLQYGLLATGMYDTLPSAVRRGKTNDWGIRKHGVY